MKDTYVYPIGNNLYLNLTNRCTNRCTFCVREGKETYEGYPLWLKNGEPSAEEVIAEIGDPARYEEVVFCGFGEPTYRLDALLAIADHVHGRGGKTRLNTNGHGNRVNGRDIAPLLLGRVDGINISLNAPDRARYAELCRPCFTDGFEETLAFAGCCKAAGLNAWFSVVDCIGKEMIAACDALSKIVGLPLKVRPTIR